MRSELKRYLDAASDTTVYHIWHESTQPHTDWDGTLMTKTFHTGRQYTRTIWYNAPRFEAIVGQTPTIHPLTAAVFIQSTCIVLQTSDLAWRSEFCCCWSTAVQQCINNWPWTGCIHSSNKKKRTCSWYYVYSGCICYCNGLVFTARCYAEHGIDTASPVCPSVMLMYPGNLRR